MIRTVPDKSNLIEIKTVLDNQAGFISLGLPGPAVFWETEQGRCQMGMVIGNYLIFLGKNIRLDSAGAVKGDSLQGIHYGWEAVLVCQGSNCSVVSGGWCWCMYFTAKFKNAVRAKEIPSENAVMRLKTRCKNGGAGLWSHCVGTPDGQLTGSV